MIRYEFEGYLALEGSRSLLRPKMTRTEGPERGLAAGASFNLDNMAGVIGGDPERTARIGREIPPGEIGVAGEAASSGEIHPHGKSEMGVRNFRIYAENADIR